MTARVTARATALRDLLSDKTIASARQSAGGGGGGGGARGGRGGGGARGGAGGGGGSSFEVPVAAHSFRVFAAE